MNIHIDINKMNMNINAMQSIALLKLQKIVAMYRWHTKARFMDKVKFKILNML